MTEAARIDLGNVLDLLLDAVCAVDANGRFAFASAGCERIFGYTPAEMLGRDMTEFIYAEDIPRTLNTAAEIMAGKSVPYFENRYVHKDGHLVHIMWSARWSEADQLRVAVARDVTELRHAERVQSALYGVSEAANSAASLKALYQQVHGIVAGLLPAVGFSVVLHDPAHSSLTVAHDSATADGAPPRTLALDGDSVAARVIHAEAPVRDQPAARITEIEAKGRGCSRLGVPLRTPEAIIGALTVDAGEQALRYTDQDQEVLQFVGTQLARAIERQQTQDWLHHAASHDPLTNLPNRWLLRDRLRVALRWAHRYQERVALLYVDLDGFKAVNDCWGHEAGDNLLRGIALRLVGCVREADTVSRVGGDEFTILLNNIAGSEATLDVTRKIHTALEQPFELGHGARVAIGASVGVAIYPDDGLDEATLVRLADAAMYRDKHRGTPQPMHPGSRHVKR